MKGVAAAAVFGGVSGLLLWWNGAPASVIAQPEAAFERPPVSGIGGGIEEATQQPRPLPAHVRWSEWTPGAFERAKKEDKLVLLDLTAAWCHACHVMDDTTYTDPAVVDLLNTRYVPIRVDTDQRPDIDARYRQGGWPTTSILLHTGEILFQANFLEADPLVVALEEAHAQYQEHRAELFERAEAVWAKVKTAARAEPSRQMSIRAGITDQSASILQTRFDPEHGGFRRAPKFFEPDAITFALLRAYWTGNDAFKAMALKTLDEQVRLLDPVWGGFYRYAEEADWSKPHHEKLLDVQARNLWNYLEAFQATRKVAYRTIAEEIIDYVNGFLLRADGSGFYASQASVARLARATAGRPSEHEYDAPAGGEREALGLPPVDRHVYTSSNALMVTSYLRAASVLSKVELRETALEVLDHLYRERYAPGRGIAHMGGHGETEPLILLADQVFLAQALVEAFLTTTDRRYLQRAEQVAADLVARLGDPKGGFFDRPPYTSSEGLLRLPQKPLNDNLRAAIVFCDLFYLTAQPHYRDQAEHTLSMVLSGGDALPVAQVGLAVDRFLRYPLHIVVVGKKDEARARALVSHAHRIYVPGKVVRLLDPRWDDLAIGGVTFPSTTRATAYVCTDHFCSKPFARPEQLARRVELVVAATSGTGSP